ncbi:uncharacterized protein LOC130784352 [Actinidia eriantha]|uniref:uncharacterized protein LOC130784352 n=1 Tax=Actinidia eriantha TaxID=165200 RepID=UPI00258464FD|nr:uncharacterized protein LOC130784352 [Actinidia eriantha]XP_057500175.1 uncharacterized protein LOC130784352 [Actinidia eriantha]
MFSTFTPLNLGNDVTRRSTRCVPIIILLVLHFVADGTRRSTKPASSKGGTGFGSRKSLNDITNKSSIRREASSRKTNLPKEKFNIAEEMFLHDHKKCMEAQLKVTKPCFWDTVLPRHDFVADGTSRSSKPDSKKGGTGFGTRKALNDITNKSSIRREALSRKTNLPKETFNIVEEMLLIDQLKCIEAPLKK